MGLIQAAEASITTLLADQWREYIKCDSIPEDVLAVKGTKSTNRARSSNTKGSEDIITNGSIIEVAPGQCMMMVDGGKIVEFAAEPGPYIWDSTKEPTIFFGGLGQGLKDSWETFKYRFTFGGDVANTQRVYYFNIKEIMGNKYGTPNPLTVRAVDKNIGLDRYVKLRCNGEYSYKITDPMLFFANVCGNFKEDEYPRSKIDSQLKSDFLTALAPAYAKISANGLGLDQITGAFSLDIADEINEVLSNRWAQKRGISIVSVGVSSSVSPEDQAAITRLQDMAPLRDPSMAGATLAMAQGEAMKTAAGNSAGAMIGFMGMNMAQMAGGMNANNLYQIGQQQQQQQQMQQQMQPAPSPAPAAAPAPVAGWTCKCGAVNTGKFCVECGAPQGWTCSCGAVNKGKFCSECGSKKPSGEPLYRCDKCGWEPEDPKAPPKFCPECGDRFDDSDIQ